MATNVYSLDQQQQRYKHKSSTLFLSCVFVLLVANLIGCSDDTSPATDTDASTALAEQVNTTQDAVDTSDALSALDDQTLQQKALDAWQSQRLHSPAGDNSLEYYLALRSRTTPEKPNPAVENALVELLPYAMIAVEQAIARDDLVQAQRLLGLIERTDANAPAIPRLRTAITQTREKKNEAERLALEARQKQEQLQAEQAVRREAEFAARQEQQKNEQALRQQQARAEQLAQQQAPSTSAAQQKTNNAAAASTRQDTELAPPPLETPAVSLPVAAQPTQTIAPPAMDMPVTTEEAKKKKSLPFASSQTSEREANNLKKIAGKMPQYPKEAVAEGLIGSVELQFTVGADGRVKDVQVLKSTQGAIFSKPASVAVYNWRYAPIGREITVKRNFDFKP